MNLVTGEIIEIRMDTWTNIAKVRIDGVLIQVPLQFVPKAKVGDHVLIEGGVAIAVVGNESKGET